MTMNASRRRGPRRRFIYFSAALLFLCGTLVCASRSYIKPYFSAPLEAPFGEFDPSDRARPKTEELRWRQVSIYIYCGAFCHRLRRALPRTLDIARVLSSDRATVTSNSTQLNSGKMFAKCTVSIGCYMPAGCFKQNALKILLLSLKKLFLTEYVWFG